MPGGGADPVTCVCVRESDVRMRSVGLRPPEVLLRQLAIL